VHLALKNAPILSTRSGVSLNFHDRTQSLLTRETANLLKVSQKWRVGRLGSVIN